MPWPERASGTWGMTALVFKDLIRKPHSEHERSMELAKQAAA